MNIPPPPVDKPQKIVTPFENSHFTLTASHPIPQLSRRPERGGASSNSTSPTSSLMGQIGHHSTAPIRSLHSALTLRLSPPSGVLGGAHVRRHVGRLHVRVRPRFVTPRPLAAPVVQETEGNAVLQSRALPRTRCQRHQHGDVRAAAAPRTGGHLYSQSALS